MGTVISMELWSRSMEHHSESVIIRRRITSVRDAIKRLAYYAKSAADKQDIDNLNRILGNFDARHQKSLGFASGLPVGKPWQMDKLTPQERRAVIKEMNRRETQRNDPAA